jgi:filamentous hemagglutinin
MGASFSQMRAHFPYSATRKFPRLAFFLCGTVLAASGTLRAGNMARGSISGASTASAAAASTSQTSTPATTATQQASQTAVLAQRAQVSMQRSILSLQAIQAQAMAQSAARNLAITGANNLGTPTVPLPTVPDGLAPNGLVPGVAGTDAANPANIAIPLPVTPNNSGGASVTIGTNTSLTLPPTAGASSQITVSGSGTVGSITTGGTITPLTAGVATTVPAGSTISLTQGGTITFGAGSSIPSSVSTYAYTGASGTVPVPASWTGVSGLSQATYDAGSGQASPATTVTVTQTAQQALLTWQSFNIGKNTTLDFDQSLGGANVGDWVAINKVADDIAPSQVLGAIQAPGQVYVINQNGIIFGGSSQVNVGALVASSLPIDDNLVSRGLLNNPDLQFLFSQVDEPAGTQGPTAAFTPQGTSSAPGSAPAPGSFGGNGGLIAKVDAGGNLSLVAPTGQDGDVVVEAGAQLSSPTTPEHVGGRVALVGPNVNNAGTISTPDGQTILAAGLQVAMAAHPANDPSLRGLDTYVGQVSSSTYDSGATGVSGTAVNNGTIEIPRADLTIAGETVDQNAVVDSSTSVSLNGRIDLLADYDAIPLVAGENGFQGTPNFYPTAAGTVTFGLNSLTEILPELSSTDTVVGTTLALSSLVNVQGGSIDMQSNALLLAPSANLPSNTAQPALGLDGTALTAGVTLDAGNWLQQTNQTYALTYTSGQVYLDTDAVIDVSGSEDVSASVAENIISAQLLGTELANSPLQQNGALRGATIDVDIRDTGTYDGTEWVGTPIGDVSGYVNLIQHSVGELTTAGGTVAINAGGSTVMKAGSDIDVSGGWINYAGAMVQTTKVISNGLVYDISQATPDQVYEGIYTGYTSTSAKYGITQTYSNSLQTGAQYEAGYIQGGNGGSVSITSPSVALDGTFAGNTVAGSYQQTPLAQVEATYAGSAAAPTLDDIFGAPLASSFSIKFEAQNASNPIFPEYSPTPPNVVFTDDGNLPAAGAFGAALPAARVNEVDLSPSLLNSDGFGSLTVVNSDGDITVPAGVALNTPYGGSVTASGHVLAGGSINLDGANIDIEGSVDAAGGALTFTTHDFSPFILGVVTPPAVDPTRGNFTLGSAASLSTAGLVVDDRPQAVAPGQVPNLITGGTITISSYSVDLASGTAARDAIDVSGGTMVSAAGKLTYGNGGSITIAAGTDPTQASIQGGELTWNPNLTLMTGYSGATGGSLAVSSQLIQVGGDVLLNGDTTGSGRTLWLNETDAQGNLLEPDFFDQGGFTKFALTGVGAVGVGGQFLPAMLIAPGTTVDPVAETRLVSIDQTGLSYVTETLASGLRAPVSLAFNGVGARDFFGVVEARGDVVLGAGATIETDPQGSATGSVSLSGDTVSILGSIDAPGGSISIKGAASSIPLFTSSNASPTIDLAPGSVLSTAGELSLVPNALGYLSGSVLPGGTITLNGNILAEAGATLDVSGGSGTLDELPAVAGVYSRLSPNLPVAAVVDSNGGTINLTGAQELFTDATLLGAAGGPSAQGGSISLTSAYYSPTQLLTPLDPTLIVTENGPVIPVADYYTGSSPLGQPVLDANGNVLAQRGYVSASALDAGGFASINLQGTVEFSGTAPVTLSASESLFVANSGIIVAGSGVTVNLDAPYVDLGTAFQSPVPADEQTNVFQAGGVPFYVAPAAGTGTLNVNAQLIDVGNVSLQQFDEVNLVAAGGDIRGDGTLDATGTVNLTAGQIYPTTENIFTIADYDEAGHAGSGTVTISASGTSDTPYSAGGELNFYASNIVDDGVLRAPLGTINLGSGSTGQTPIDYITGSGVETSPAATIPNTVNLTLGAASITSVSGLDNNGQPLDLPYGTNSNGISWIDPAGNDITIAGNGPEGVPTKTVNVSGVNIDDQAGAVIDIAGGGDLYSYSFVPGTGGTNDILTSSTSFAVIPGYGASYAPYYSSSDFANSSLAVGEQVYLNASNGLPAGVYTLLPARYALEPGAFLVTPISTTPPSSALSNPDGSSTVSGYAFNGLDSSRTGASPYTAFQVDSSTVVAARASYDVLSANTFFPQTAAAAGIAAPRLPVDAGQLVLAASQSLSISGSVESQAATGGAGGLVDIASSDSILISGPETDLSNLPPSTLVLDSSSLSAFGADSLLIGGYRQPVAGGDSVTVTTNSITVDNAGATMTENGQTLDGLSVPDLVLVSNQDLTLAPGAELEQSASAGNLVVPTLYLQGNGAFVRVSANASAQTIRSGVDLTNHSASLVIGAGAILGGTNGTTAGSVTLDSTHGTSLDSTALIKAATVNLDSSQISLELTPPAVAPVTDGLVLSSGALTNLQASAQNLSLLSYSSIDIYGSGDIGDTPDAGSYPLASVELHAAEIRGYDNGGGVVINANDVTLDNGPAGVALGQTAAATGGLVINAQTIHLGTGQVDLDQFNNVTMNAADGLILDAESKTTEADTSVLTGTGAIATSGSLTLNTPLITAGTYSTTQAPASETISAAGGDLLIAGTGGTLPTVAEGLGATLVLTGQDVIENSVVELPSGSATLHATTGGVTVSGTVSVAGTAETFDDATGNTPGGTVNLIAAAGSVDLLAGSSVDVAANAGGGNAGSLAVSAPTGGFTSAAGTLDGQAGTGGTSGTFSLDAGTLSGGLEALDTALDGSGFTQSISIRDRNDSQITLDGSVTAATYNLSADTGSITIDGTIDASDVAALDPNGAAILVGGTINVSAAGSLTLASGSELTVAAQNFNNAGKGGSITLTTGANVNGDFTNTALNIPGSGGPLLEIDGGSTLDLSVAANNSGSAALGDQTGTLTLFAPQISGNTDLQIAPINGTIVNASSIVVAGVQVFNALDGSIDNQESNVMANGTTFAGNTAAILGRLYASNANAASDESLTAVEPAAQIVNPNGNLTLSSTWDLSTYRFGPAATAVVGSGAPGILTLRAAGSVVFDFGASLTDGFNTSNTSFAFSTNPVWTAPLLAAGEQSWSYQIVAGSDLGAADSDTVESASYLAADNLGGSVVVGAGAPALPSSATSRTQVLPTYFQTIRTGTGNITIDAGGNVELINNLATIYTAGTQAPALAGFTTPTLGTTPQPPNYGAQYSMDGGNIVIAAQGNIEHETASGGEDSSLELPSTWLDREGAVDASGNFVKGTTRSPRLEEISWWVDFSNYLEGVAALGGGNVTLTAGASILNVDASIPTNARMSGTRPVAANLLELGGGDLVVQAGADINGGVYYVERGQGSLDAGDQILTNSTRAAVTTAQSKSQSVDWLPTTLFLGDGSFNVTAGGDALLGPVVNPFWLPQPADNGYLNESYFSTYAATDTITVSALTGSVTLKDQSDTGQGSLDDFYNNVYLAPNGQSVATSSQPWLISAETSASPFSAVTGLLPPTLDATAYSGDIDLVGSLTLTPSATGTVNLFAAGTLNGFQPNDAGFDLTGAALDYFGSSTIDLSDANPSAIPTYLDPLSNSTTTTNTSVLNPIAALFAESGATSDLVLQTRQTLHADINDQVLHANDPNPVQLYANSGDISGITLYSGKTARVIAGNDITDVSLYVQNDNANDITLIAAGRDIIPYDIDSAERLAAATPGNELIGQSSITPDGSGFGAPNAGDIQISGPGTLEVLAGRNLNLGVGPENANGTGTGISSIGNTRDPYLPFSGADVIGAAGLGTAGGFDGTGSKLDFAAFETQFLEPGSDTASLYLPQLGELMGLPAGDSDNDVWQAFGQLPASRQDALALDLFYLVLRDAGRNHNEGTGTGYTGGYEAIADLFPTSSGPYTGDISLTSREIVTTNGGDVDLLAPGGQLTVGYQVTSSQPLDQGIITEDGGNINIFTQNNVNVGTSRIFTLHGGNIIIWSTVGDIAAGSSSKTVQSAPPTRVLVDPQSGSVQTDLAGLATGGGIGVLETVVGAPPSDVDLIAPSGTVDAGDAGIRVSGNLNIAAARVVNAGNISVGGKSAGVPSTPSVNIAGLGAASSAAGAANNAAAQVGSNQRNDLAQQQQDLPSIITVEVLGYGG